MPQGDIDLSRARGAKAQRKQQFPQYSTVENTIEFRSNTIRHPRHVELRPKTRNQEQFILSLTDPSVYITVAAGPAGTGKSYLAMLAAIRALQKGDCDKIILTRPAVGVENEQHGFLPGDLTKKMEPWTRPLLDILKEFYHPREVLKLIEDEVIEISPLAYMRGRTFKNAWIVADEMQNATPNQIKMLLTRIGENSRIVVTGDVEQTDQAKTDNGLLDLCSKLKTQVNGLRLCELGTRDVQRHPIITTVLSIYS